MFSMAIRACFCISDLQNVVRGFINVLRGNDDVVDARTMIAL